MAMKASIFSVLTHVTFSWHASGNKEEQYNLIQKIVFIWCTITPVCSLKATYYMETLIS
jgi:hypothetical protein